jgi:hypothetical protein
MLVEEHAHEHVERRLIVTAIFARTDVPGLERLEYELTADAIELGPRCSVAVRVRAEKQDR